MYLGTILNVMMVSMKKDLSCLLKLSKPVPFLGGANAVGFLVGWFKTAKYRFGLHRFGESSRRCRFPSIRTGEPEGSRNAMACLSLVGTFIYCLCFGAEELIYRSPLQIYLIGEKLHESHFKQYFHNYFCVAFYLTLNECVQLHLVTELTFKFPGATYKLRLLRP